MSYQPLVPRDLLEQSSAAPLRRPLQLTRLKAPHPQDCELHGGEVRAEKPRPHIPGQERWSQEELSSSPRVRHMFSQQMLIPLPK